jgi:hypothetical protein
MKPIERRDVLINAVIAGTDVQVAELGAGCAQTVKAERVQSRGINLGVWLALET